MSSHASPAAADAAGPPPPNLIDLVASLEAAFVAPARRRATGAPLPHLPPERLTQVRTVVMLVIDGVGAAALRALRPEGALAAHRCADIDTVFPPTTASAITTLLTGLAPVQHGLPGWFVDLDEVGAVTAVLPVTPRAGAPFDAATRERALAAIVQPALAERMGVASHAVLPADIVNSDFSVAHHGSAARRGYADLDGLVGHVAQIAHAPGEPRYVYAYVDRYDATAHRHGWASDEADAVLESIERAFETLLARLRGTGTLVVGIADHGFVDVPPERQLAVESMPEVAAALERPLAGEWRAAFARVRAAAREGFAARVHEATEGRIRAVPSADLLAAGWFGAGAPHPRMHRRVGDFTLLAQPGWAIRDAVPGERVPRLVGLHGGTSPAERSVPLLVAGPL